MRPIILIGVALSFVGGPAEAADHVRVILDTSGSMAHTDPARLARLSTILLYDLARPSLTTGDTFQVIAFEPRGAVWRSGPPPEATGPRITPRPGAREIFASDVHSLPYTAEHTYYYPVLKSAIDDLERSGVPGDRRVIVFVTDGQPEDPDVGLIARELVPRLLRLRIQLYVLAFGNEAQTHGQEIQAALGGNSVGDFVIDRDGSHLMDHMIEIFSRGFGYYASTPQTIHGPLDLDLEDHQAPNHAAVVVYWRKPEAPPFDLHGSGDTIVNNPDGVHAAREDGASYAMTWALSPGRGLYRVSGAANEAVAVVLRPAAFLVDVQPGESGGEAHATLADEPLHLRIQVSPPGGVRDFQGPVKLAFVTHGPRAGADYVWSDLFVAPQGSGRPNGRGVVFDVFPRFRKNPQDPKENYLGFLTVEVQHEVAGRDVPVGSLVGARAHQVLVYPNVHLTGQPDGTDLQADGTPLLHRGDVGCASFQFFLQGDLPKSDGGYYSIRALLPQALADDPRMDRSEFRLDDETLEFDGSSASRHGRWFSGNRLTQAQLLGPHKVCMVVGKPKNVDAHEAAVLSIDFKLILHPYDKAEVFTPFRMQAHLVPPTFFEKYGAALGVLLGIVAGLAALWYLRYRATVPPDLVLAVARDGYEPAISPLGPGPFLLRALGLGGQRSASAEGGSFLLGFVQPVDVDLYSFRCASGIRVLKPDGSAMAGLRGSELLAVNRDYIAESGRGRYRFRLQYS
jgi:hypothetical protein